MRPLLDRADVERLQRYALQHPLAEASAVLSRHHLLDVHRGDGAGLRIALSLNK